MKANEIPKKIYAFEEDLQREDHIIMYGINQDKDISGFVEYTNTDAFIKKALKWYCLDCECNDNCKDTKCFFCRQFERYLKGEKNAIPPKFLDSILNEDGSTSGRWRYRHFIAKMQDAFIEKAFEFFSEHLWEYIDVKNANCDTFININCDKLKENFKNYMKGE